MDFRQMLSKYTSGLSGSVKLGIGIALVMFANNRSCQEYIGASMAQAEGLNLHSLPLDEVDRWCVRAKAAILAVRGLLT
jgi:hypothetical protein